MICSGPPTAKVLTAERLMCDVSILDRQLLVSLLPFDIGAVASAADREAGRHLGRQDQPGGFNRKKSPF